MPRPSSRENILDAYEDLLTTGSPPAVTLEAVARRAQVSKGGLLYHFGSKEALRDALLARNERLNEEDLRVAEQSDLGVVEYYLRTSLTEVDRNSPLHRSTLAVIKLAIVDPRARATVRRTTDSWRARIARETGDDLAGALVTLLGDGLYLHSVTGVDNDAVLGSLDETVRRLLRSSPPASRTY